MLKIGSVKWRGKCSRHPGFDPAIDGPGAIRGNCSRCMQLHEIHEYHQKMIRLMRGFHPVPVKPKAAAAAPGLQQNLFA